MISKWYLLRVGRFHAEEKSLSLFGGLSDQEEKTIPQIQKEIRKALDHGYQKIALSWNFIYHSEKEELFSLLLEQPEFFVLSVHKKSILDFSKLLQTQMERKVQARVGQKSGISFVSLLIKRRIQNQLKKKITKQLILNHLIDEDPFFFKPLEKEYPNFVLTLLGCKKTNLNSVSSQLKYRYRLKSKNVDEKSKAKAYQFLNQLFGGKGIFFFKKALQVFVSFPCSHKKHLDLYSPVEIYSFLSQDFYPPPPFDTYNLSIPSDLKLEPSLKPQFEFQRQSLMEKENLRASVIIPVYRDFKELSLTLKHLSQQDINQAGWYQKEKGEKGLDKKNLKEKILNQKSLHPNSLNQKDEIEFEVIVIDDGSPEDFSSKLKSLDFLKEMNFKFLSFPRDKARTSSKDHRFRAGLARNQGARTAKGDCLFFLDADILVPPSYISSGVEMLEKHPVIQHPRYHLIPSAPQEYQKIVKSRHCFERGQTYWEDFYESSQNWNERELSWKYISTNTLCLKAELFKQAGAFRKNYTCYGFEDTDLGYRLYQAGVPFHLHKLNTYHLYRESEHQGQEQLKQELLGLSVLTFFHNTHCLPAYKEFAHLIKKTNF